MSAPTTSGPTLRDVAAHAAVSLKTASRVLNEDPKVATATRELVMRSMRELDYSPDPAARSLKAGRDKVVGVVVDSVGDVFFAQLVAEVESVLDAAGYRVLIASSNRDGQRERDTVRDFVQRRCSGLIVAPLSRTSLSDVRTRDVPVVFVDRVGDLPGSRSVVVDDAALAHEATAHLLAHGHRRVALLSDRPVMDTTRQRHEGFRAAMAEAGLAVDERLVRSDVPGPEDVMRVLVELLALDEPPTALISTNTRLTLGVVPALHQHGRTDVALVAFGDFPLAESLTPAVTVVEHSPEVVGAAAARALLEQMQGPPVDVAPPGPSADQPPPAVLHVPARLVPRGSGELSP